MLLTISGSLRRASTNTKLLAEAARLYGTDATLADIRLPLYDGDLEQTDGIPDGAQTLANQIAAAEAIVISTPEYNFGPSAALKNALDWVSRVDGNPWLGKPLAIMAAAAGRSGGARATIGVQTVMHHFKPLFSKGPEILLAASYQAFDDDGRLTDDATIGFLTEAMETLRNEARHAAQNP